MKKPQIVRPPKAPKKEGPWISTPSPFPPGPPPSLPPGTIVMDDTNALMDSSTVTMDSAG